MSSLGADYLRARGVLEATFSAYGGELGDPRDTATVAERLNRGHGKVARDPNWPAVEAILWFPIYGASHELVHWLARPLPKLGESKFVAPTGSNGTLWIPPETYAVAKHVSVPLTISEGPIKGMVLTQAGAHPVAPVGVWTVAVKSGADDEAGEQEESANPGAVRVKLHPTLQGFQLAGRKVFMAFDADRKQNPHVRHAEIRAWMALFTAGADVFQLCTWELKAGKGIDDYIAGRVGTDTAKQCGVYRELFEQAKPFIETLGDSDVKTVTLELHRTQDDRAQFELLRTKLAKHYRIPKDSFRQFRSGEKGGPATAASTIPPTARPWDEPVEAKEVLDEICTTIHRFESFKHAQCRAVALWCVLTYLHDAVDILPILLITAPEEDCGKTTLLTLVSYLSNRPVPAGNVSAAAIYRTIKDIAPTMALDEADSYLQDNEEMRGVIDSGHQREFAWIIRTAMEGEDTVYFSTWCPKALAMIGLPKRTILSRSIHIRLERKSADVKTEKLKRKHYGEFEDLRRKISRLANDIRERVRVFESDLLENRAADNWQPLLAIADAATGGADQEWVIETARAAAQMSKKDVQDSKSIGRYLLESLDRIIKEQAAKLEQAAKAAQGKGKPPAVLAFVLLPTPELLAEHKRDEGAFFLPSAELVAELNKDEEAPWKENKEGKTTELTTTRLAALLKKFDLKSEQLQVGDTRARGYWADALEREIKKYAREGG
jgi:Domain of unknown function (DUF3854)/Protein of unknown function (DUF3631)